jgi:hypothetical protein
VKEAFMSSMTKRFKKNKVLNLDMSIKFKCPICGFERLVPQMEFKKMTQETFKNNKLFLCDNFNIRMNPITVEVDY